jgi:hypothetical protein
VRSRELDFALAGTEERGMPTRIFSASQHSFFDLWRFFSLWSSFARYFSGNTTTSASLRRPSKLIAFLVERLLNDRISQV